MKKRKNDGSDKIKENLYFDDFVKDMNYFDDISLRRTIYFFIQYKNSIENKISKLSDMLFTIDVNDNSVLYFQKKTIIGFMLVSGNYYKFMKLLKLFNDAKISVDADIEPPNKWSKDVIINPEDIYNVVKEFVDTNIDISSISREYKEYFCLNYRKMKTKDITGIKCEDKKPIVENQIYEEIIIKLTHFIYYYVQINKKKVANIVINHYVLHFLNSDRAYVYNLKIILNKSKKYSNLEMMIYNKFNDINESTSYNSKFKILRYIYQFKYKDKQFSTCGETTLLNILNYCLIKNDGTFDTSKISNDDVIRFYEGKYMTDMFHQKTMTEWLDIVSNLGLLVYNTTGDIHNNVKNIACVLNKLVYNNDSCIIEDSSQFIVDTIEYLSSDKKFLINIEKSSEDSLYLKIDNYSLFFRPGHGEMNNTVKNAKIQDFIDSVDLERISEKNDDFAIMYNIFKELLVPEDGEKLDYDEAISRLVIKYFLSIEKDIVKIFLLNINKISYVESDYNHLEKPESIKNFIYNIRNVKDIHLTIIEENDDVQRIVNNYVKYISEYCRELTKIDINIECESYHDINLVPLSDLKNLSEITIGDIFTKSVILMLKNLKNKEKIKTISLPINDHTAIDVLEEFVNLEDLTLQSNGVFVKDLKPLEHLTKLKSLWISPIIFDVNLIKKSHLEKLNIYDCKEFNNIESFSNLVNLKEIIISRCNLTKVSIEPIINLNLDYINIYKTKLNLDDEITIYNKNVKPKIIKALNENNVKYVFTPLKI